MGKLFGTDGIRGVVGENLTADLAFRTGKAIAAVLKEEKGRKPVLTIGKDTRISSDMLENALVAGICSVGADVELLGKQLRAFRTHSGQKFYVYFVKPVHCCRRRVSIRRC